MYLCILLYIICQYRYCVLVHRTAIARAYSIMHTSYAGAQYRYVLCTVHVPVLCTNRAPWYKVLCTCTMYSYYVHRRCTVAASISTVSTLSVGRRGVDRRHLHNPQQQALERAAATCNSTAYVILELVCGELCINIPVQVHIDEYSYNVHSTYLYIHRTHNSRLFYLVHRTSIYSSQYIQCTCTYTHNIHNTYPCTMYDVRCTAYNTGTRGSVESDTTYIHSTMYRQTASTKCTDRTLAADTMYLYIYIVY